MFYLFLNILISIFFINIVILFIAAKFDIQRCLLQDKNGFDKNASVGPEIKCSK